MVTEFEVMEERLNLFMSQLQSESRVFERIVYKNKNQHRRCSYFHYLLKVRRDLRLLQSAKLEQILGSCFHVIGGKKPKQKVHLLESLKWKASNCGTPNFMERLLGVARLLSQMVEPMLKGASGVSILLARSFFMGFCLTILALLARLRVLVQQILVDAVKVFNMVNTLSQEKQSVKLTEKGIEVFREYYPTNKVFVTLDCVWNTDKFVLIEETQEMDGKSKDDSLGDASTKTSAPCYRSINAFLGDDDSVIKKADEEETGKGGCFCSALDEDHLSTGLSTKGERTKGIEAGVGVGDDPVIAGSFGQKLPAGQLPSLSLSQNSALSDNPTRMAFTPVKRPAPLAPAFVSVKRQATSPAKPKNPQLTETQQETSKEDSFFNLLTGGNLKDGLF